MELVSNIEPLSSESNIKYLNKETETLNIENRAEHDMIEANI